MRIHGTKGLSREDYVDIAERAAWINERNDALFVRGTPDEGRLDEWKSFWGSDDDWESFLVFAGLTGDQAAAIASAREMKASVSPPAWIDDLKAWLGTYPVKRLRHHALFSDATERGESGVSCAEPLWQYVEQTVAERFPKWGEVFLPGAFSSWRQAFVKSVEDILWPIYDKAVNALNPQTGPVCPSGSDGDESRREYLLDGSLMFSIVREYPVTARLLTERIVNTMRHLCELISSIEEWGPSIFGGITKTGRCMVSSVSDGMSDSHCGGKSVHTITFEDSSRVVYKPRSLAIDRAWERFVGAIAEYAGERPYWFPSLLDCDGYGFVEFVESTPVSSESDYPLFFHRAGFLMGLVTVLNGCDFHEENVIAHGSYPVYIDLETVLVPMKAHPLLIDHNHEEKQLLLPSGFLPYLNSGRVYTKGCDSLTSRGTCANLPFDAKGTRTARQYHQDVIDGFQRACQAVLCMQRAGNLLGDKGALTVFSSANVRVLLRSTMMYVRLRTKIRDPEFYRDGYRFSIQLFWLARMYRAVFKSPNQGPRVFKLLEEEIESMERGDIPRIELSLGRPIHSSTHDDPIDPVNELERSIAGLSESRISHFCDIIGEVLRDVDATTGSREICAAKSAGQLTADRPREYAPKGSGLTGIEAQLGIVVEREERRFIYSVVPTYFLSGGLGNTLWYMTEYLVDGDSSFLQMASQSARDAKKDIDAMSLRNFSGELSEGVSGIALTADYCYRACGEDIYRDMRDMALRELASRDTDSFFEPFARYKLSLIYGAPGVLFALGIVGDPSNPRDLGFADSLCAQLLDSFGTGDSVERGIHGSDGIILALCSAWSLLDGDNQSRASTVLEGFLLRDVPSSVGTLEEGFLIAMLANAVAARTLGRQTPSWIEHDLVLTANDTILVGNAGRLLLYQELERFYGDSARSQANATASHMLATQREQGIFRLNVTGRFPFPCFFHGFGGVNFALARNDIQGERCSLIGL